MRVKLIMPTPKSPGNIFWHGYYPMRNGAFPSNHPVTTSAHGELTKRWGWVSCFPEGDGIVFELKTPKTEDEVRADIIEVLGFELT